MSDQLEVAKTHYFERKLEASRDAFKFVETHTKSFQEQTISFIFLVHISLLLGNNLEAIEYGNKALDRLQSDAETSKIQIHANMGIAWQKLGKFHDAIGHHKKALDISRRNGHLPSEMKVCGNLGNSLRAVGQYAEAFELLEKQRTLALQLHDTAEEGKAYSNLGSNFLAMGKYEEALRCHQRHYELVKGDLAQEGIAQGNIGAVYQALGNYEEALKCNQKFLELATLVNDKSGIGTACANIGIAYQSLGRYQDAEEHHRKDLAIAQELGDRAGEGGAYGNLGNALQALNRLQEAFDCHCKHLEIAKELKDILGECHATGNLGNVLQAQGRYHEALDYYSMCFNITTSIQDIPACAMAAHNLGLCYYKLQMWSESDKNLQSAIYYYNGLLDEMKGKVNKVFYFQTLQRSYDLRLHLLTTCSKWNDALLVSEQKRARVFVEENFHTNVEVKSWNLEEMARTAFKYKVTFVEYAISRASNKLFTWVLQPTGDVTHHMVDWMEKRELRTQEYYYERLIQPIARLLPQDDNTRVVFIPDDDLWYVDFAFLHGGDYDYFIKQCAFTLAPSILAFRKLAERSGNRFYEFFAHNHGSILLAGNPIMPQLTNFPYKPLPGAEREVNDIAHLFRERGNDVTLLTGQNAMKSTMIQSMPDPVILHLATHASWNYGSDPLQRGGLAFTQDNENPESGMLTTGEISTMKINAWLVTLSACSSFKGVHTADGVHGLVRAFLDAGAGCVLAAVQPVPDPSTSVLMKLFYQQLVALMPRVSKDIDTGLWTARALRHAILKYMDEHNNAATNWGNFMLLG